MNSMLVLLEQAAVAISVLIYLFVFQNPFVNRWGGWG